MELKKYKDFIKESKKEELWTYNGTFTANITMVENGKFIKDKIPDIVNGTFVCSDLRLTSLEGGPVIVNESYYCNNNLITSLKGSPKEVLDFVAHHNYLRNLEHGPEIVNRSFICSSNLLTTLINSPKVIKGKMLIDSNYLYSLEGICVGLKVIDILFNKNQRVFIERDFAESDSYKNINTYWLDLLSYMAERKINLEEVKGWPEGFLTDEVIKSAKGITKFNL